MARAPSQLVDSVHEIGRGFPGGPQALAAHYWRWLDSSFGFLIQVMEQPDGVRIKLLGVPVIELERQGPAQYQVRGGALAHPGGRFDFVAESGRVQVALVDFRPRLPLWLYRLTHGAVHEWSMRRFTRHLHGLEA